ncbi:MAG TPA: alpha-ketoglutarate-dependent dioxygenase AlkB [Puia sp.]|uniref:alpha-ketoglutarate-dependent dioxygenase AlkB n=1 Tax=Puia sp. TaxID=2045100 RepID=UPI002B76DC0C|nr:alpha-ketoglutarate-dependent dioxygenase AlkB [Puia sp.]HVU97938.1 alpha-ketoglutarate-dependent dioxygenase AlkB [Puia sp.]
MITGITFIEAFVVEPEILYDFLQSSVNWNESMIARKTASFGKAYNYSQMEYPFQAFLPELEYMNKRIEGILGFTPNNCLINFYPNGKSSMGFHSDQTDILEAGTGVAIISLGEMRSLRFRNIADTSKIKNYDLPSGSLIYMSQEVQKLWQHSIPKADTENGRMSLTFRRIK